MFTIWIFYGHIIYSLVWMGSLDKVCQSVSEKYLCIWVLAVQHRHFHVVIGVPQGPMEGTIDQEQANIIRSVFSHLMTNVSHLILPSLPELCVRLGLITVTNGSVCGAVQEQDWC